ncbi:hypothetical protein HH303_15030 [Rhodospirillaceae bacterium KN72]|uniref:HPr kinase/phosphorylase C-terminal domain-containing protein n=1 Tax=Pacificispira spongiicola TaxID=2729598 RepID=A0A7Y0E234_9PROT|nr:HPr kinase/phosphatase C-terminal domain-containing protein [Pacificispira spongiicola]NMM45808.1 hypothetical protein [Pacificispira spongiicola]
MPSIHATTVAIDDRGVLLTGPSGSGKSDLALRLIEAGAELVADDRTSIEESNGALLASAPAPLVGLLEVRGVGLIQLPHRDHVPVALVVDLDPASGPVPRLPEESQSRVLNGVSLPCLRLNPFEASAPTKVRAALTYGLGVRTG